MESIRHPCLIDTVLLVMAWDAYQQAIHTKPYDRDRVQALGMRFATEWNRLTPHLQKLCPIPEADVKRGVEWDYNQKTRVMGLLT